MFAGLLILGMLSTDIQLGGENSMYTRWNVSGGTEAPDGERWGGSASDNLDRPGLPTSTTDVAAHIATQYWVYSDWSLNFTGGSWSKPLVITELDDDGNTNVLGSYQVDVTIDPWSWQMDGPKSSAPKQNWPTDPTAWHTDGFGIEDVTADPFTGTVSIIGEGGFTQGTFSSEVVLQEENTYHGTAKPYTLDSPPGFFSEILHPEVAVVGTDTLVFQHTGPAWQGSIDDTDFTLTLGQVTSTAVPMVHTPEPSSLAIFAMLSCVLGVWKGVRNYRN